MICFSSFLQKAKLGWIVSGIANSSAPIASSPKTSSLNKSSAYKAFITMSEEPVLDQLLQTFWALEEHHTNSSTSVSPEEQAFEDFFETTTTRCPKTNQFIVRLPFKEDPSSFQKMPARRLTEPASTWSHAILMVRRHRCCPLSLV
ncbi:uncharacterized protein LOC118756789 [Rhagoletis pomonella]|uniref:uncharacterized protein LOC118756789 n=1 Tax=Rhagoletis pomonella TaxID=28610 RepID=UPI0017870FFC|nr:uncharacterized protein LOC118756789 [Rhagoletis pomonella]